jgi:hypothetical protein
MREGEEEGGGREGGTGEGDIEQNRSTEQA